MKKTLSEIGRPVMLIGVEFEPPSLPPRLEARSITLWTIHKARVRAYFQKLTVYIASKKNQRYSTNFTIGSTEYKGHIPSQDGRSHKVGAG